MSSQVARSQYGKRTAPDYLRLAGRVIYAVAGLLFFAGLYFDWKQPGQAVIEPLVIAMNPQNSGLFLLAIIVLVVGFVLSKAGDFVEGMGVEEVDQTQEWTVKVGKDRR